MTAEGLAPKKLPKKESCSCEWMFLFLSLFPVPIARVYQRQKQTDLDYRRSEIQLLHFFLMKSL